MDATAWVLDNCDQAHNAFKNNNNNDNNKKSQFKWDYYWATTKNTHTHTHTNKRIISSFIQDLYIYICILSFSKHENNQNNATKKRKKNWSS